MSEVAGRLVLVLGTGTEVGKTWVSARVLEALRADGVAVAAHKPAQSFEPGDVEAGTTDAQILAAATGQAPGAVCPPERWYPAALAPPMAAEVLGLPLPALADLLPGRTAAAIDLVEAAGGVASPIAVDGDGRDLAAELGPDLIVLVADAGLGTISAVRTAAAYLGGVWPLVVHLNRYDAGSRHDLHRRNRDHLAGEGFTVTTDIDHLRSVIAP